MKEKLLKMLISYMIIASPITAIAGDAAVGKAKAAACIGCHGIGGLSNSPTFPNLRGQKMQYTIKQLKAFKDGSRKDPTMNAMVKSLSVSDFENIAAYYSSLK